MFDDEYLEDTPHESRRLVIPVWLFITIFFAPPIIIVVYLTSTSGLDNTAIAIIGLAIMNGSINSVIAWLTIRLDGHSNDALDHLDTIMGAMEEFDDTISNGMDNVNSFTADLDEAKGIFSKVGVDLTGLDLEPVADVVEKLKENKADLAAILDGMKEADFSTHLEQIKSIDWGALLSSVEEVMLFIESRNANNPSSFVVATPKLPTMEFDDSDDDFFSTPRSNIAKYPTLNLSPPPKGGLDLRPPSRRR
jgi:hypothetical protein